MDQLTIYNNWKADTNEINLSDTETVSIALDGIFCNELPEPRSQECLPTT